MNLKKTFSVLFIGLLAFSFIMTLSQPVHAANPTIDKTCKNSGSPVNSITCTLASVPQGDLVVVATQSNTENIVSLADNTTNLYTAIVLTSCISPAVGCGNGNAGSGQSEIWVTLSGTTHGLLITLSFTGAAQSLYIEAYAVSNVGATATGTGNGQCNANNPPSVCSTGISINSPLTLAANGFAIASVMANAGCSGYTTESGMTFVSNGGGGAANFGSEYSLTNVGSDSFTIYCAAATSWDTIAAADFANSGGAVVQTQTNGDCTATATGGTYLANSTQYWYSANALGQEAVSTIKFNVENIKGSGSHTLQMLIYYVGAGPLSQTPSVGNPAGLAYATLPNYVITSGTTNSTVTIQVSIPLNTANAAPLPFNYWAIAVVGDDHIRLHNSATSGMTTQTGTASTTTQPVSFTGKGTGVATKLAICAIGNYQSVLSGTTTTTAAASTTNTSFTTITSTINTIGPQLFSTQSNWPVIFLILLLPAGLFMAIVKSLAGALLGLMVGSVIGLMMGILPIYVFLGIIIALASIAFIAREKSA